MHRYVQDLRASKTQNQLVLTVAESVNALIVVAHGKPRSWVIIPVIGGPIIAPTAHEKFAAAEMMANVFKLSLPCPLDLKPQISLSYIGSLVHINKDSLCIWLQNEAHVQNKN